MEDAGPPLPPPPLPAPLPAIPAPALTAVNEEEDELEALIPPTAAAAAAQGAGGADEGYDELEEHYRGLQEALGEVPGQGPGHEEEEEGDEPPAEALGAEALLERCVRRLRGIEAALDENEVRFWAGSMIEEGSVPDVEPGFGWMDPL